LSVMEAKALDMSLVLLQAQDLGDWINGSAELADYLYWKNRLSKDAEAQALIRKFAAKKEHFAECERFGHFHPDYHAALQEAAHIQEELEACTAIAQFRRAEEALDMLLHEVSTVIAHAVSDTIKVPGNESVAEGGCSSGSCSSGSCGGKCG
jgi:cell fate (sporulation/competence/biofilm development) regulator YlbF (YheA/YmcA/DUF963 family)